METFNEEATILNLDGIAVPAKLVLCETLPTVILGLEALKALTKKWFVRLALNIVITAINGFKEVICTKK